MGCLRVSKIVSLCGFVLLVVRLLSFSLWVGAMCGSWFSALWVKWGYVLKLGTQSAKSLTGQMTFTRRGNLNESSNAKRFYPD